MGDKLVSGLSPDRGTDANCTPISIYEIISKMMPFYLAIGMSSDEFWNCDPIVYGAYRQAHKIRQSEENQFLWIMGRYVYDAVGALSPVLRTNLTSQVLKAMPYVKSPYPINPEERDAQEEEQAKLTMETIRTKALSFASKYNTKGGTTDGNEQPASRGTQDNNQDSGREESDRQPQ